MLSEVGTLTAIWYAAVGAVLGLILGSAINAMVWRLYVGRSWAKGRSECPDCGHKLAAKDLVPVLSWLFLGGKCRYCKAPIKDHPVVELVTAAVFAVSAVALAGTAPVSMVRLGFWVVLAVMLLVLAVYDARWLILPDKIMLPMIVVALAYMVTLAIMTRSLQMLTGPVLAAFIAGGGFFALVYFSKGRAMGGGDIKLAFAMGLMLGLQGTALAMMLAFNVAAAVSITLIVVKRRKWRKPIPFGPYLVLGTITAFLFGRQIIGWYLRLNGLS